MKDRGKATTEIIVPVELLEVLKRDEVAKEFLAHCIMKSNTPNKAEEIG